MPRYQEMPRPDLVGITAFTSQAPRAYEIAARFRRLGVPVVMGGIHATMCVDEVMPRVDAVVTGEADTIWPQVLEDAAHGRLKRRYDGGLAGMDAVRPARHDLLPADYAFGAIQTTRGCPMNCTFCSYTLTFPVARYRHLSQPQAIEEMLACDRDFYAWPRILGRVWSNVWRRRQPLISLCANLSYRRNLRLDRKIYAPFSRECGRVPGPFCASDASSAS
jgi:radical SAM superfamily enzyme YgiQ (UPF0313 family)